MKEVKNIEKKGTNTFHNYKYAEAQDIIYQVREAMIKHGLILQTSTLDYEKRQLEDKRDGKKELIILKVEFTLVDVDTGESLKSVTIGEGVDKTDKGAYKAYTGALKYYLRDRFMLSFGDDPEDEKDEKEEQQQVRQKQQSVRQKQQQSARRQQQPPTQNTRVSGADLLKEAKKAKKVSNDDLKFLAIALFGKFKDLTDQQFAGLAQFINIASPDDLAQKVLEGKKKVVEAEKA
jgi:hypothetical protein